MRATFYNRDSVVLSLAIGGLIALGKDIIGLVEQLYRFALTPNGLAALVVASVLASTAGVLISAFRR